MNPKLGKYEIGTCDIMLGELVGKFGGYHELELRKCSVKTGELMVRCFRADKEINYIRLQFQADNLKNFGIMTSFQVLYKISKPRLEEKQLPSYRKNKVAKNVLNKEDWKCVASCYVGKVGRFECFPYLTIGAYELCYGILNTDLKVYVLLYPVRSFQLQRHNGKIW